MMEQLRALKNLLINCATGGNIQEATEQYVSLRNTFLINPNFSKEAPKWLINCRDLGDFWSFIKGQFPTYEERRQFIREELDTWFQIAEAKIPSLLEQQVTENPHLINDNYIDEITRKAIERKTNDPDGAITLARTLLESVCKKILLDRKVPIRENLNLPQLYHAVSEKLNLAPSSHSEPIFKKILGSCTQIVGGIGTIRNNYGDSHALKPKRARPESRHAALVINLAFSMSVFLLETATAKKLS